MNAAPGTPGGGLIRDNAELVELTGVSAGPGGDISLNALRSVAPLVGAAQFEKVSSALDMAADPAGIFLNRRSIGTHMETPEVIAANRAFAEAQNLAEGRKQANMATAAKLKNTEHATAVKAADRAFFLELADAADRSGGLIGSAGYRAAAAAV